MTHAVVWCALLLAAPVSSGAQSFCEAVTADPLVSPTVVGSGTPGSVTTAAIQAALNAGGHIRFNIGASPATITIDPSLTINRAVVLDGGGLVTLSGGNARRIIQITNTMNQTYAITLQNISFADANTPTGRGAAIFKQTGGPWQAVSLKLVNTAFANNSAMLSGQDDGGGALYATGMDHVRIGNSTFTNNRGSNGGAVYSLGSRRVTIVDSVFTGNQATGTGGNPGNGGNAGALGIDGADRLVDVCRTTFLGNTSNAYGAGFFSVMYDNTSRSRFEDTTFDGNRQLSSSQFAGGAYIQGGPFAFERVSVVRNEANGFTGLFVGPGASGTIRNATFVANVARQGLGAAMAINQGSPVSIVNTTIANNVATAAFAGGISVGSPNQLRLTNVILANNTGGNVFVNWNIQNAASQDGGGNMQWPQTRPMGGGAETPATPTTTFMNPQLAASVAANGGFVPTLALTLPSPARDTAVVTGEVPATDARGVARFGPPDRGSYEVELPVINISDASVTEGNSGTRLATFTVTLTQSSSQTVTVQWATANSSATAPSDFVAAAGQVVTFNPGQISRPASVTVNGDIDDESDETFFVNLTSPSANALLGDAQGVGTIVDDDPSADLSVTKTDGVATAAPGQMLTYTITVANTGPNAVTGASVTDVVPSGLTGANWTCAPAGGAACGAAAGSGSIAESVNLPVGGSVVYTLTGTVAAVPATVRNIATAGVPPNFIEPNPANNSATDDDFLLCDAYSVLVPDGRLTEAALGAGGTAWHVASLRIGSSYSAEFTNLAGGPPPTLTVFRGDDGCTGVSTAVLRDTTAVDPATGSSVRVSFTGSDEDARYRFRIVNGAGTSLSYALQVAETTLFSPAWSTNGTFDTYYSVQNTTNATVAATLTLRDVSGSVIGTAPLDVPAGRTLSANTSALGTLRNRAGTAQLTHDGPPGALIVESAIANFTLTTPYIQPVKFVPAREQR